MLLDARARASRLADPYVWLDVHILDALCELGRRHGHPATPAWVTEMRDRAARTGMRELTVRALLHGAALGDAGDGELGDDPRRRHRQPGAGRRGRGPAALTIREAFSPPARMPA